VTPWQPTHAVPEGGTRLWATPDAAVAPTHQLDGGLPVQVVELHGAWTRVTCANGFGGWVDGRVLRPLGEAPPGPAARPPATRRWVLPVAVAAIALVGSALFVATAGGDGDDDRRDDVASSDPTTVALHVPDGWSISEDGLVAAEDAADVDAAAPAGPVVRAEVGVSDVDLDDPALLDLRVAGDDFVFTEADSQTVDGFDAVLMTVRGQDRVQAFLAVDPPGQDPVFFTIDCPADRFDELRDLLASVPGIEA
jgi:hypothetical protein